MILPVRRVGIELLGQLKRRHANWIKTLICFNHARYILWDLILAYSGIGFAFKTLPKALRTQALAALTSDFGLVGLVQYAW